MYAGSCLAPSAGGTAPLTGKRISRAERADGADQHAGGPDLAGDPVDEPRRRGRGRWRRHLGPDMVGEVTQRLLTPVGRHTVRLTGARVAAVA